MILQSFSVLVTGHPSSGHSLTRGSTWSGCEVLCAGNCPQGGVEALSIDYFVRTHNGKFSLKVVDACRVQDGTQVSLICHRLDNIAVI